MRAEAGVYFANDEAVFESREECYIHELMDIKNKEEKDNIRVYDEDGERRALTIYGIRDFSYVEIKTAKAAKLFDEICDIAGAYSPFEILPVKEGIYYYNTDSLSWHSVEEDLRIINGVLSFMKLPYEAIINEKEK